MTDKVQKIREEVERIRAVHSLVDLKESNPDILVVQACTNLLSFIDSLQEEPVSEDICNQCEARHDKDKCDKLVFSHKCPIATESLDFDLDAASEEYTTKVLERTNMLVGNGPVGEEINAAFRAGFSIRSANKNV